ncbi:MAG: hypothetical protein IJS50_05150, partial [Desulfovibrio sp.]|nr:hypothetical protein [Desulfovibrio sp.]
MSQVNLGNHVQQNLLNNPEQLGAVNANPQPQPDLGEVNAVALGRLSDMDRAAAEVFLKGVSTQEALKHTKWSLATKIISGLFTFGIAPAIMCRCESRKERQLARDVVALKDTLNNFDKNKNLSNTASSIDGKAMAIERDEHGVLTATIGGERIVSKYNAKNLAEKLENDIVTNTEVYGKQAALNIFANAKNLPNVAKGKKGHIGQSLPEQFEAAMAKSQKRMAKAEDAFNLDQEAVALKQELNEAQTALDQLQAEFDQTEIKCNQTLRQCDEKLKIVEKLQKVLDAEKRAGTGQDIDLRQVAIDQMRESARGTKNEALNKLRELEQRKPELYKAMSRREMVLSKANGNVHLRELLAAQKEQSDLTANYTKMKEQLTDRLKELETSPNTNSLQEQSELAALKSVLAKPEGPKAENPWEIKANDQRDALDSKGINDARHRELCLKAIKAHLGLDGGQLHSCPTRYLDRIARYALEGYFGSATNLLDHVLKITTTSRIASQDVMELMSISEQDAQRAEKVNVAVLKPANNAFKTATQKQVANFAADIIYSGNLVDEDKLAPEARLRKVLQENAKVIGDIIKVEANLTALDLESKASEGESLAKGPNATAENILEAKALRAEANAAQFAAKALSGNVLQKSIGKLASFFSFSPKKVDESQFSSLESLAAQAEAKAFRAELEVFSERQVLLDKVARAQAEVAEHEDNPAVLSDLVDAQKALEKFDKEHQLESLQNYAKEARLKVRLARAEAQAELSGSELDKQKATSLREAIESAKPGLPEGDLGAEFDVPADTVLKDLGGRLTELEQLPEDARQSLLEALPAEMTGEIKEMLAEVRNGLLEENVSSDTMTILAALTQVKDKDLQQLAQKINENVVKASNMVQEEMTIAILMMDATLTSPTKAVLRALKASLEAEHLPVTSENATSLLERKPMPQAVKAA